MSEMKKEIEKSILRYFKDKKMDKHAKTTDLHNFIRLSGGLLTIKLFFNYIFNHLRLISEE